MRSTFEPGFQSNFMAQVKDKEMNKSLQIRMDSLAKAAPSSQIRQSPRWQGSGQRRYVIRQQQAIVMQAYQILEYAL